VPLVAGCATGFGAPTREAVANLQAASVDVGQNLKIRDLIVALPDGQSASKGGVAYIEFTATNLSDQPDKLNTATATVDMPASGAPASAAPVSVDVSSQQLPVGSTDIPGKTAVAPGTARVVVALDPLEVPLLAGQYVLVTLTFANSGAAQAVATPVQGADTVGSSFLPSAAPSLPSSEEPAPATSAPDSPPASAPASDSAASEPPSSAPASSPAA